MEPEEMQELERLAGKDYIERTGKRKVAIDKDGKARILTDTQKVTGLDAAGVITEADLEKISFYECGHPCIVAKTLNTGGKCIICGALFCNAEKDGRPTCSRNCIRCKKLICLKHVKGKPGDPVYCSFRCFVLSKPLILEIAIIIFLIIIFSLSR